jgi:hypothetical protein
MACYHAMDRADAIGINHALINVLKVFQIYAPLTGRNTRRHDDNRLPLTGRCKASSPQRLFSTSAVMLYPTIHCRAGRSRANTAVPRLINASRLKEIPHHGLQQSRHYSAFVAHPRGRQRCVPSSRERMPPLPPSAQNDFTLPLAAAAAHAGVANLSLRDGAWQAHGDDASAIATTSMPAQTKLAPANTAGTVTTTTIGTTTLMWAAGTGQTAALHALLNASARIDQACPKGTTALMHAALRGQTATLQALLQAGASLKLKTTSGRTALNIAIEEKH